MDFPDGAELKRNGRDNDDQQEKVGEGLIPAEQVEVDDEDDSKGKSRSKGPSKRSGRGGDEEQESSKRHLETGEGGKKSNIDIGNGAVEGSTKRRKRQDSGDA